MVGEWDILLRMVIAVILGGLVGIERSERDKPAGIRTHALVAGGAALFVGVSSLLWTGTEVNESTSTSLDVSRVMAAVVTGIGFLGAGSIMQSGATVKGLTTAAGIWTVAAIGVAIAFGFFRLGLSATVLVLLIHLGDYVAHRFTTGGD